MEPEYELSRDLENGYLFVNGERIFAIRIKTYQAFIDHLKAVRGKSVSTVLCDQIGKSMGHAAMAFWKNRVHRVEDVWKLGDEVFSHQGCGRLLGAEERVEGGTRKFIVRCRGTPISYERNAAEPTCDVMRGFVQGWVETYLEKAAASSTETQCESMGSSECVFEVTFVQ